MKNLEEFGGVNTDIVSSWGAHVASHVDVQRLIRDWTGPGVSSQVHAMLEL